MAHLRTESEARDTETMNLQTTCAENGGRMNTVQDRVAQMEDEIAQLRSSHKHDPQKDNGLGQAARRLTHAKVARSRGPLAHPAS